jgi:hypothetical protein
VDVMDHPPKRAREGVEPVSLRSERNSEESDPQTRRDTLFIPGARHWDGILGLERMRDRQREPYEDGRKEMRSSKRGRWHRSLLRPSVHWPGYYSMAKAADPLLGKKNPSDDQLV